MVLYLLMIDGKNKRIYRLTPDWIRFDGRNAVIEIIDWKKPFDILLSTDTNIIKQPAALKTGDVILLKWVAERNILDLRLLALLQYLHRNKAV